MIEGIIALILVGCVSVYLMLRKPRNFPPGPPALPIVGSIPFIPNVHNPLTFAAEWFIERYGKVVGCYIGTQKGIAVYDFKMAKDLFAMEEMSGRPEHILYMNRMFHKKLGILFNDNAAYRNQRRFAHRTLRDFGFGKSSLESVIQEESDKIVEYFNNNDGKSISLQFPFNTAILNSIWLIVAGQRYELGDERVNRVIELLGNTTQSDRLKLLFAFPWLRHIIPEKSGWNEQREVCTELKGLITDLVKDHKETYNEDDLRDFTDVYMKEIKKGQDPSFYEEQLIFLIGDLFIAGSDTTSTTLSWAVLYMLHNPEVMKKVQEEIDTVLGDATPTIEDKGRLVYTHATLMEVLRLSCILPHGIPHRAMKTVHYEGFTFPKGTMMYPCLRYIMRDPSYWDKPDDFIPERFIETGPNGKQQVRKEERLVPFGIGRRVCLGETLAKIELFIFFVKLMQNFTFSVPKGQDLPTLEPIKAIISGPQPYDAVVHSRHHQHQQPLGEIIMEKKPTVPQFNRTISQSG